MYIKNSTISLHTCIRWLIRFNQDSEQQGNHILLEKYLDWKIIFKILLGWIEAVWIYFSHLRRIPKYLDKDDIGWIWPVLDKDWKDSWLGPTLIQNIIWAEIFDKMLGSLPKQRIGFYLMENQGWERIFLHFWRYHGHGKNNWCSSFNNSLLGLKTL